MRTHNDAKAMARSLREALSIDGLEISNSWALEIVARRFGLTSWNVLAARISAAEAHVAFQQAILIVRIFDVGKAREFYLGFLGFTTDWEHRFAPQAPLYTQVSRAGLSLHLSEYAGDATPGGNMVIYTRGLRAFQAELTAKNYRYMRSGLEPAEWGPEMDVIDPFNNRIRFIERA